MKELKKIATELGYLKENENDRFKGLDYGIEKTKDYTTSFLDFLKKNIKTVKDDDPKALKRVELRYYQAKFGHNFYELVLLFNNEKFDKTITSFQNAVVIFKNLGVDTSLFSQTYNVGKLRQLSRNIKKVLDNNNIKVVFSADVKK
tara:strand:+ start:160 stop:597 length:438 start_codon:yes stop_codon:yes gene_type:complete